MAVGLAVGVEFEWRDENNDWKFDEDGEPIYNDEVEWPRPVDNLINNPLAFDVLQRVASIVTGIDNEHAIGKYLKCLEKYGDRVWEAYERGDTKEVG